MNANFARASDQANAFPDVKGVTCESIIQVVRVAARRIYVWNVYRDYLRWCRLTSIYSKRAISS